MKIDYNNITGPKKSVEDLLLFLLWCTVTPGKKSETITPAFNSIFTSVKPSDLLNRDGRSITAALRNASIGQYKRLSACWRTISQYKPYGQFYKVDRDELTKIPGIGPKTASFFVLHSRPHSDIAVLDVHILRYLKRKFPKYPVPEQTPQDLDEYKRLEAMFLGLSCQANKMASEFDTELWQKHSTSQTPLNAQN